MISDTIRLWPHQLRAMDELQIAIAQGHTKICLTCPTGGGKTRIMTERLKIEPESVLYTHRRSLLDQTSIALDDANIRYGFRAAGKSPALLRDTQLAMIQTEHRSCRDPHPAKQILVDESHNNAAGSALALFDRHDGYRIGFTATPLGIGHAYDKLIIAGTNSELRECGALVPAIHYAPNEPGESLIGRVKVDGGECAIPQARRMDYCWRVFGSVIEHYNKLNREQRPTILFAPGVAESIWFCEQFMYKGMRAAHIDGENCWVDGELHKTSTEVRNDIRQKLESGDLDIVCNRFVLREGVDWPFLGHCIFATVFGGLTAYLQAGGRLLRSYPGLESVCVQDHGGNARRHGSLNADRNWDLALTDAICEGLRTQRIRERQEPEPIICPKCGAVRLGGPKCFACGFAHDRDGKRPVLQSDGTLTLQRPKEYRPRRYLTVTETVAQQWKHKVLSIRKSKKNNVSKMTWNQLACSFAKDRNWQFPPSDIKFSPVNPTDWYRPVKTTPIENLR